MNILKSTIALAGGFAAMTASPGSANPRIKDIVDVESVRDNQLVGYGLVVGLKGTGDKLRNAPFTEASIKAMMERMGVNISAATLKTSDVAAVMVTADLLAFARAGSRIDVHVAAIGDSTNLMGGTLVASELKGMDGQTYAVAQGPVAVAGFDAKGAATQVTQGTTTTGRIASGGIVEREVGYSFASQRTLKLALRNPDFTTATRIAQTINKEIGSETAMPLDPATVEIRLPNGYPGGIVQLVTNLEQLPVEVDQRARVVVDSASGTVVMGDDVKVSRVAIAQGNLTISIAETPIASQPAPFSGGATTVLPRTTINVDDGKGKGLAIMNDNVSLRDLVNGLNALRVTPRDLITILQSLKAAGALQADVETM